MIDFKKATKQELTDLLLVDARAIESMIEMRKKAVFAMNDIPHALFTHDPQREIHVSPIFFKALADYYKPLIAIIPKTERGENLTFDEKFFYLDLLGKEYKIFCLYTEETIWNSEH